jgi:hypothetical protein
MDHGNESSAVGATAWLQPEHFPASLVLIGVAKMRQRTCLEHET